MNGLLESSGEKSNDDNINTFWQGCVQSNPTTKLLDLMISPNPLPFAAKAFWYWCFTLAFVIRLSLLSLHFQWFSRWWFYIFFTFTPNLGEMI